MSLCSLLLDVPNSESCTPGCCGCATSSSLRGACPALRVRDRVPDRSVRHLLPVVSSNTLPGAPLVRAPFPFPPLIPIERMFRRTATDSGKSPICHVDTEHPARNQPIPGLRRFRHRQVSARILASFEYSSRWYESCCYCRRECGLEEL